MNVSRAIASAGSSPRFSARVSLPLWAAREDAGVWLEHWPGYEPRHLGPAELTSSFLGTVSEADLWIGAAVLPESLVTVHPSWLRAAVASASSSKVELDGR